MGPYLNCHRLREIPNNRRAFSKLRPLPGLYPPQALEEIPCCKNCPEPYACLLDMQDANAHCNLLLISDRSSFASSRGVRAGDQKRRPKNRQKPPTVVEDSSRVVHR